MVQFVSSSEPDNMVSHMNADSAQSPSQYEYSSDKGELVLKISPKKLKSKIPPQIPNCSGSSPISIIKIDDFLSLFHRRFNNFLCTHKIQYNKMSHINIIQY